MKKIFSILLALSMTFTAWSQEQSGLWREAPATYSDQHGLPVLRPERYSTFTVTETGLKDYLSTAPQHASQARTIELPMPEGGFRRFRFWETPVIEPALAKQFPEIRTYTAEAIGNRTVTAKLDYTPFGFHAVIFDGSRTYLIEPYTGKPDGAYIAYYKKDNVRPASERMVCHVGAEDMPHPGETILGGNGLPGLAVLNGNVRKVYRLALACTGEYAVAVSGGIPTVSSALAQMTSSINRVNGVYERELSVSMQLVSGTTSLIFLDGTTDPYSNNSGGAMLGQNQSVVDSRIGSANYDIGHVFSTGGGGIASLGCVCRNGFKAAGVTGSSNPRGDAFDIDFVAHEMGHQFGANHTFNANTGSCLSNGVVSRAYEPGSGSTIMGYAGLCTTNNIQGNSDPYFHSVSLEEIATFISNPATGGSCPTITASSNSNATLPSFAASYSIPFRTPFELTAPAASDNTADEILYCWEQRNLGDFGKSLAQTQLDGPLFRSFLPDPSRTRVFITPFRLLSGVTSYHAEKLPEVARTLTFRMTERDIYQGWGAFNFPDDAVTLNVVQTSAPFVVTGPAEFSTWTGGEQRAVTWNVVGTNTAPINCSNVDIYMSVDGGYTWPILVKANTPNDGSETITVPNPGNFSDARIKVKGAGNVFFNISGSFTLLRGTVGVTGTAAADDIIIAPVPAREDLQISIPSALGTMQVRVLNTFGQTVWKGIMTGRSGLPVATWARGIYHIQMHNTDGISLNRRIVLE